MARQWTHTECFKFYNVRPKNPRWSWSGRSDDGSTVAVTLWQDRFQERGQVYRNFEEDQPGEWRSRPGFVELLENLKHAKDVLGGTVRVILAKAKDPNASPRSIDRCWPQANLLMRVDALDMEDGKFTLQRIDGPKA
jgi:hypothetical protein